MTEHAGATENTPNRTLLTALAWLWVTVPFGYGLIKLLMQIPDLFSS